MEPSPYLRTPFTDITGCLVSHQWHGRCSELELKFMECLEGYGLDGGLKKCDTVYQDFKECTSRYKQFERYTAMRKERLRQFATGERSWDNIYEEAPKRDSY